MRTVRTVRPMNQNQTQRTHYELLGVAPDADAAAVKAAYRKLVRTMHPDVGGNSALFGLITEAKECLSDPSRRAKYDRDLAAGGTGDDQALRAAQAAAAAAQRAAHDAEAGRLAAVALLRQGQSRQPLNADQEARAAVERQNAEIRARVEMAREQTAREFAAMEAARAGYVAERRRLHPLRLWLPMIAAVLLGVAATYYWTAATADPVTGRGGVSFWFTAALLFRASYMALFGGFLITHRNALAPLRARGAAAICLAWALVTALGGHLYLAGRPLPGLLPAVVFVAVMATGLRAQDEVPAGLLRTLWGATVEALRCVKAALLGAALGPFLLFP